MSNSTALVGTARVGQARVGSLGDVAPPYLRASGGCWKLVHDPEIVKAAQDAKDYADTQDQAVLDEAAILAQDKADAAQAEAIRLAEIAATEADEALEAALGDLVADKSNVFIQDTPPVEEMQKPGVLWIDTTPVAVDGTQVPGNTPRTWDGTTWVAITDSATVQAAAEAAAAHQAAEDAATAAGEAMAEARYAPRIANRPPTQADGLDKPIGAGWHEYGETTNHLGITEDRLVQTWMWTGSEWVRLDMDPQMVPAIQIGTGTFGDLTGDRVTVTGTLSANIVDAMDLNTKKLVVTEEAILNHATLIGQTVVDDINVQGKLIGTDGVFTGTVDFENINVTGEAIVEKLSGNTLSGVVVEAGAADGTRTLSLRDNVNFGQPGIEFNSALYEHPPSILGYSEESSDTLRGSITIRSAFGLASGNTQLTVAPEAIRMARWNDPTASADGLHSRVYAQTDQAGLGVSRTGRLSGDITSSSYVTARQSDVFMGFTSFGNQSYLQVSSSGPRFVRWAPGSPAITAPLTPDIVPFDTNAWWDTSGSPTHGIIVTHTLAGRHCRARLRLRRVGETFNVTTSFQEFGGQPIPPNLRTSMTDYIDVRFPTTSNNDSGVLFINYATSQMQIRTRSGTIPVPNGAIMYADLEWFIPN